MRVSVNVPAAIAAICFAVSFLGSVHVMSVNVNAFQAGGLFFLALTPMLAFFRGNPPHSF